MCVCTITPQQMELDLAHTLKTPSVAAQPNDLFMPTEENFKAAVDVVLQEAVWFKEWAERLIDAEVNESLQQYIEEDVDHYFRNFDASDHFDIDEAVERVLNNYDFDDEIESHVDNWLCNNLEVDDAVKDAVSEYFDDNVDVDEVAKQNLLEILKDSEFIEALAAEMLRQQQQAQPAQTQGDSNDQV